MLYTFPLLILLVSISSLASAHHAIIQDYTGPDKFMSNFDLWLGPDPNEGLVEYLGAATALQKQLVVAYNLTDAKDSPQGVVLKADATEVLQKGQGRKSIRAESVQSFNQSLIVAEILHMPGSTCGLWPAFFLLDRNNWPKAGEVDVIEQVNDAKINLMSLHTTAGLTIKQQSADVMKGKVKSTNCNVAAPEQVKNMGCGITDEETVPSYGDKFNAIGGGTFVVQYVSDFIKIWFFPRNNIPTDIKEGKPTPPKDANAAKHAWGKPNAFFQSKNGSMEPYLHDLRLIFQIDFCGQWAGSVWKDSECAKKAPTCEEYVAKNPDAYKEAFWAINSLKVFKPEDDENHRHKREAGTGEANVSSGAVRPQFLREKGKHPRDVGQIPTVTDEAASLASATLTVGSESSQTLHEASKRGTGIFRWAGRIPKRPQGTTIVMNAQTTDGIVFDAGPTATGGHRETVTFKIGARATDTA